MPEAKKRFEFLEHTADVYVAAYGSTLEEAFENAALALFEAMTDTSKVDAKVEESVEARGVDEQELLYDWLENLLVRFDETGNLYSRFRVEEIKKVDGEYRLRAKIWGEPFDPEKHPQRTGVKAITYHLMEIRKGAEGVVVKFLLDV